jgi:hypothetical protein
MEPCGPTGRAKEASLAFFKLKSRKTTSLLIGQKKLNAIVRSQICSLLQHCVKSLCHG